MKKIVIKLLLTFLPAASLYSQVYYSDSLAIYDFVHCDEAGTLIVPGNHAFIFFDVQSMLQQRLIPFDIGSKVTRMDVSEDESVLLAGFKDGNLLVMTLPEGQIRALPSRENVIVTSVGINREGTILAAGYADGQLFLFDQESGTVLRQIHASKKAVNDLAFIDDGAKILTACGDGKLKAWNINFDSQPVTIGKSLSWLRAVSLDSSSRKLVVCGDRGLVKSFSGSYTGNYRETGSSTTTFGVLTDISYFPSGEDYVLASYKGLLKIHFASVPELRIEWKMKMPVYRIRTCLEDKQLVIFVACGNKVERIYVKDMTIHI